MKTWSWSYILKLLVLRPVSLCLGAFLQFPNCHLQSQTLQQHTGYRPYELKECILRLHKLKQKSEAAEYAVRQKYMNHRVTFFFLLVTIESALDEVSNICISWFSLNRWNQLQNYVHLRKFLLITLRIQSNEYPSPLKKSDNMTLRVLLRLSNRVWNLGWSFFFIYLWGLLASVGIVIILDSWIGGRKLEL